MFGDRLKLLRNEKNMTQQDLAKLLNASPSTIGMYEQGRRDPDTITLKFLADYFNVSIDYILGKSDIKEPAEKILQDELHNKDIDELTELLNSLKDKKPAINYLKFLKELQDKDEQAANKQFGLTKNA